jgi:hypothetical protein
VPVSALDYDDAGKLVIAFDGPVAKAALVDGLAEDTLASQISTRPEQSAGPQAALGLWPWSPART